MGFPAIILPKIIKLDVSSFHNAVQTSTASSNRVMTPTIIEVDSNRPASGGSTLPGGAATTVTTGGGTGAGAGSGSGSTGSGSTGGSVSTGGGYSTTTITRGGGGVGMGAEEAPEVTVEPKNLPIKNNRTRNILLAVAAIGVVALIAYGGKSKKLATA